MTHRYGYARVSTTDQNLDVQIEKLKANGCEIIRQEKVSGTSRQGRKELDSLLEFIRSGGTLVVTKIDRLARSIADLQDILRELQKKGAHLAAIDQPIDTSTPAGKCFFDMLGAFAEFEASLRKERQLEGIAKAKQRGVYKGRKPTAQDKASEVLALKAEGVKPIEISRRLGIGRASVYRILGTS